MIKIRFEQDKICKNLASKQAVGQPFSVYVPNSLLPDGQPPKKMELTMEFE